MPEMGNYCKAYYLARLRSFSGWTENAANARPKDEDGDGKDTTPRELSDDSILYLQENYVVTDGIFKDQHVIFDSVDSTWKEFCQNDLGFKIPDHASPAEKGAAT
jgi:hypothetical protein